MPYICTMKRFIFLTLALFAELAAAPFGQARGQWVQASEVNGDDVPAFAVSGSNLFAIIGFGLGRSTDNGTTWTDAGASLYATGNAGGWIGGIALSGTDLFAGADGGLFRSTDDGTSWTLVSTQLQGDSTINELAIAGANFFARTSSGIFRSSDSGKSWSLANNGLPKDTMVIALTAIGTDLFAGTPYGGPFRSTDSGNHWSSANAGMTADSSSVSAFASIGTNIFASTVAGVFRSTDQGDTWFNAGHFLSRMITVSGSNLFAGLDGVYLSTDSGTSWSNTGYNQGMFALAVNQSYVFTGTYDIGVWRRPLSDFGISSVAQTPVAAQPAIQSFPNPFTQSTEITFTTQAAGYAEVSIVNALGAEVARLFAGELGSGSHSFDWDADRMSAPRGVYWCVVKRDGVEAAPIALVR